MDTQIEVHTKAGYTIVIGRTTCGSDEITITNNDRNKDQLVQIVPAKNSIFIATSTNLHIKASNIEIEAEKEMRITSGSVMTLNGSTVKIN